MLNKLKNALKNLESKVEQTKDNMIQEEADLKSSVDLLPVEKEEETTESTKDELVETQEKEENTTDSKATLTIEPAPTVGSYKVDKPIEKPVQSSMVALETYNIQELINVSLKQFAPLIVKKGIRVELDALDCDIITNQEVILFIFQEIISNAINHTIDGVLSIYLLDHKSLVIQDTGSGIPKDELAQIFDEGYIASNGVTSTEHNGLGLYKVAIALEKMSYSYEIQSIVGKGTAFLIDLK